MKFKKSILTAGLTAAIGIGCGGYNKVDVVHNFQICCSDYEYDNDLRCVSDPEGKLEELINSVYEIKTNVTYIAHINSETEMPVEYTFKGSGTLFKGNYIMTADHVVTSEKIIEIPTLEGTVTLELKSIKSFVLYNGTEYPIEKVIENPDLGFDYAWLKAKDMPESAPKANFNFGTNYDLKQGDFTYVIGNLAGMGINVTSGEISRTKLNQLESSVLEDNYFIISNPAGPGNSGCPVFGVRDGRFEMLGVVDLGLPMSYHITYVTKIDKILDDALMRLYTKNLYNKHPTLSKILLRVFDKD